MFTKIACNMVLKFGTETLLAKGGEARGYLDQRIFDNVAAQIVNAQSMRFSMLKITLVSSGAIQEGRERIEELAIDAAHLDKKGLAAIGARHLLNKWGNAFAVHDREVGQVWVTHANWKNRSEWRNIHQTILQFHNAWIIPIVNENDVVSAREVQSIDQDMSENDRLARMIARRIRADAILFVTNVGGVYESDPYTCPDARMYKMINIATIKKLLHAPFTASSIGSGGMRAKLIEATKCFRAGMRVAIAGMGDNVIYGFANDYEVGTRMGTSTSFY
ncbi:MAG: hypothetical protein HY007_01900 [Candidatus Sungbacteria bacterium]|nr:hypothetical protein [Candidatus Sungbacteria bacterium]